MFQSAQLYYLCTTSLLKAYTVESDDDRHKSPSLIILISYQKYPCECEKCYLSLRNGYLTRYSEVFHIAMRSESRKNAHSTG